MNEGKVWTKDETEAFWDTRLHADKATTNIFEALVALENFRTLIPRGAAEEQRWWETTSYVLEQHSRGKTAATMYPDLVPQLRDIVRDLRRAQRMATTMLEACEHLPSLVTGLTECYEALRASTISERADARRERIASRPKVEAVEMGRKCIACQRKPARIDDYCKKCARANGIIVHGKIGGA